MNVEELSEQIKSRADNVQLLSREAASNPQLIPVLIAGIGDPKAAVKFKCLKLLNLVSARHPETLYPYFNTFSQYLESSQNIFKWNAIDILANLVAADDQDKFAALFQKYYGLLDEGSLITAGHVVESSPAIIRNRPGWEPDITRQLLRVQVIPLPTEECRNILSGKVILTFASYIGTSSLKNEMLEFARRQLDSTRPATRQKAEAFIRKFGTG